MIDALAIIIGITAYVCGLLWGARLWTERLDGDDANSALPFVAGGVCGLAAWAAVKLLVVP